MTKRAIQPFTIQGETTASHSKKELSLTKGKSKKNLGYWMKYVDFSIKTKMSLSQETGLVRKRVCPSIKISQNVKIIHLFEVVH